MKCRRRPDITTFCVIDLRTRVIKISVELKNKRSNNGPFLLYSVQVVITLLKSLHNSSINVDF